MYPISNTNRIQTATMWENMSAPVKKVSSSKKDLSLAVNDETLKKMWQIGYNEAAKGKTCDAEYSSFMNECREKVAPDRKAIFAEAERKMRSACRQLQRETNVYSSIFDYILEAEKGEGKEYRILETSGTLSGGSFRGRCGSTGWLNINAYDENGESVGVYYTSMNACWRIKYTAIEEQCRLALNDAYNAGSREYYNQAKTEKETIREKILSTMDYYA